MKLLLLILFSGLTSFAQTQQSLASVTGDSAQKIYEALNVDENHLNPGALGASVYEKSIGGLTCRRSQIVYPGAQQSFKCVLKK